MKKAISILTGLILLIGLIAGAFLGVRALWITLSGLNPELGAALVTGFFTVTVSIGAVALGRYLEKVKEVTEVYREKRQKVYEEFIDQFQNIASESGSRSGKPDRLVKFLRDFNRKIILWAGPATVRAYVDMMARLSQNSTAAPTVFSMETFYKAMRKDLGLSNAGIQRGDFLCLILKIGEARDLIDASVTDPNITLEEIGRRSKTSPQGEVVNSE